MGLRGTRRWPRGHLSSPPSRLGLRSPWRGEGAVLGGGSPRSPHLRRHQAGKRRQGRTCPRSLPAQVLLPSERLHLDGSPDCVPHDATPPWHLPYRETKAGDTCSSHFPFKLCKRPGRHLNRGFCFKRRFGLQLTADGASLQRSAPTRVDRPGVFHRTSLRASRRHEAGLGFSSVPAPGQSSGS